MSQITKKPSTIAESIAETEVRLNHLQNIRNSGIEPFPSKAESTHSLDEAKRASEGTEVKIRGRIITQREMGKLCFSHLQDASGRLQIALSEKELGKEKYKFFNKNIDNGDFLQVKGEIFLTHTGEKTVKVKEYSILSKALFPLPEKWHGLSDIEVRYRKRYLDILVNNEVRERLLIRSKIISAIRSLLDSKGFIEVETPTLQPIYGGGFARPFKTHHNALGADFYLRISDEMYLKRLLVGGFEKVYEITKVFRNEGIDHDHNPEFTMFEAQIAYEDYKFGMDLFEEIFEHTALCALQTTEVAHGDIIINLKRPWKRMRLIDAVKEVGGIDVSSWEDLDQGKKNLFSHLSPEKNKELTRMNTLGELTAFAFEELVEEKLIQPTIIYDYPVEVSPLAKKSFSNPNFTERFEAFALGSEIGNNYSELNDPLDLEKRFVEEKKKEEAGFDEAHQTDYDYLEAIKHGMPPSCGLGIGIDRMIMLLTGAKNIKEVIAFPTLRPEK